MKKTLLLFAAMCMLVFFSNCASSSRSTEAGETEMAEEVNDEQMEDSEETEINELP